MDDAFLTLSGDAPVQSAFPRYARVDTFLAPPPTLITLPKAPVEMAVSGIQSQPKTFARPETFLTQPRVAVPSLDQYQWAPNLAPGAVKFKYARPEEFSAPPKFAIIVAATTYLPGWFSTDGTPAIVLKYARALEFVTQPRVTVPSVDQYRWFGTDGAKAVQLAYAPSPGSIAPDKVVPVAATVFLPSWLGEVAAPAKQFTHAPGDTFSAPPRTLATAITGGWLTLPAAPAQPPKFASVEPYLAPARVLPFVETITLDKWRQLDPVPIYRPHFSPGSFTAPVTTLPTIFTGANAICASAAQIRVAIEAMAAAIRPAIEPQDADVEMC